MSVAGVDFRHESAWASGLIDRIPRQWRRRVAIEHGRRISARDNLTEHEFSIARRMAISDAANSWLIETVEAVAALKVPADMTDSELCEMAEAKAREAMNLAGDVWPATVEAIRARLGRFVAGYGLPCPALPYVTRAGKPGGVADGPAIARMTCPDWWRRGLRKVQGRGLEAAAIRLGYVARGGEIYASDATVDRRTQQNRRNAATLAGTEAVNLDTGEVLALDVLAAASVANPAIRRGELMTRIAGFEHVAGKLGHVAEFVTLTCPAAYHAKRMQGGKAVGNDRWNGATPKQAQTYLTRLWANARAALWRRGIRPYGFRIAEPHHDGTPHWHMLFFVAPMLDAARSAVGRFRAILRRYALREDGGEPGARSNRIKFVRVEAGKGSAAGYVAKYIAKNIDGFQVQADLEGMPAVDSSRRVAAWAAAWGIRQFQQIGGPPVGVWRELRRLPKSETDSYPDVIEAARAAADVGPRSREPGAESMAAEHWAAFVGIMGGPNARRGDFPVRLAYTRPGERWDSEAAMPYSAPPTRYGETAKPSIYGVREAVFDLAFPTSRGWWEIKRGKNDGVEVGRLAGARSPGNNCSRDGGGVAWRPLIEGFRAPPETAAERETREFWERWKDESERESLKAEIRHASGAKCANGAHVAGAGDPDHRGASGHRGGTGGSGPDIARLA